MLDALAAGKASPPARFPQKARRPFSESMSRDPWSRSLLHRTSRDASISWRVDDAEQLQTCERASFDGVVSQLALMDIADLDAALKSIRGSP